jgi:hypothetical protein
MNEQRAQPHKISRGVHIGIGTGMGLTFKTRDPCTRVALSLAIPAWVCHATLFMVLVLVIAFILINIVPPP